MKKLPLGDKPLFYCSTGKSIIETQKNCNFNLWESPLDMIWNLTLPLMSSCLLLTLARSGIPKTSRVLENIKRFRESINEDQ